MGKGAHECLYLDPGIRQDGAIEAQAKDLEACKGAKKRLEFCKEKLS